jgi:hypothetical protein
LRKGAQTRQHLSLSIYGPYNAFSTHNARSSARKETSSRAKIRHTHAFVHLRGA